jgi:DNA-binding NarL/FixJ family response regulator
MKKIKTYIVDDHKLFRNGLNFILKENENIEVIGEASNGKEFLEVLQTTKPDLVLMDIRMPEMNGIEASRQALQMYPDLNILVLTMFDDEQYYNSMIDIGVRGFILKDADTSELKIAIQKVCEGNSYFSQELLLKIIKNKNNAPSITLSERELDVLTHICKGYANYEIADMLNISLRTVERHRANLLEKTGSNNSIKLVLYALKNNMVSMS